MVWGSLVRQRAGEDLESFGSEATLSDRLQGIAVLETLDEIDWCSLKDCYGTAVGVPNMIRALTNRNSAEQSLAVEQLWNQICHQATCCEATPQAIPFLVELCQHERIKNREQILSLLLCSAIGLDSDVLHTRANMLEYVTNLSLEASVSPRAAIRLACYRLVANAVPVMISLLADNDRRVRINAAYNLAWFPGEQRRSLPRLREQLQAAPPAMELANLILSTGILERQARVKRPVSRLVRPLMEHSNRLVRIAAAIYLGWHETQFDSKGAVLDLVDDESLDGKIPFYGFSMSGYARCIARSELES